MASSALDDALTASVGPALEAMGFVGEARSLAWTQGRLQIRNVIDSKATDRYSGQAFTLEFEVSDDGRFEEKLAGRVRIDQLLDAVQRRKFLDVRNAVARRLESPPAAHLAQIDPSVHGAYLERFQQSDELELGPRFWMRFSSAEDLNDWCDLIIEELPTLVGRARDLPAQEVLLGKPLDWG